MSTGSAARTCQRGAQQKNTSLLGATIADALDPARRPRSRLADAEAEDLLQDALLRFVEHHEEVPPRSWRAWIHGTFRNLERHRLRALAIWRRHEPRLLEELRGQTAPSLEPDARLRQKEVLAALSWLLCQVARSRRDVAERVLLEGESLEEIAHATQQPLGTVSSKWTRAMKDMRTALQREESSIDRTFFAVLWALVGVFCLWLFGWGRRAMAASAGSGGWCFSTRAAPITLAPPPSLSLGRMRTVSDAMMQTVRERIRREGPPHRVVLAFSLMLVALPLMLMTHTALCAPDGPGASFQGISADLARERPAEDLADDRPEADLADDGPAADLSADLARERLAADLADDRPAADLADDRPEADLVRERAHLRFVPDLSANAEPAEPSAMKRPVASEPTQARAGGISGLGAKPASPAQRRLARGLLSRANAALLIGDGEVARGALRLYDLGVPSNPFPTERADLEARRLALGTH